MMKQNILLLFMMIAAIPACSQQQASSLATSNTEAAYDMRFSHASARVPDSLIIQNLSIELSNPFPIWREELGANLHIIIRNLADNFMSTQANARLIIYSPDDKIPLYWSVIDITQAKSTGPGTLSIISLPIGATKDINVPVMATSWADINIKSWPDISLYDIAPTGKYIIRLELEILDENDNTIGTALSNFVEFTSIHSDPHVVIPN